MKTGNFAHIYLHKVWIKRYMNSNLREFISKVIQKGTNMFTSELFYEMRDFYGNQFYV